jgi:hypothetical protein
MLQPHELETLRRSAAMAPLATARVDDLIDTCARLLEERRAIADVLAELPSTVGELRAALNRLHQIVR